MFAFSKNLFSNFFWIVLYKILAMSVIKETIYETPDIPEVEEIQEPETFENKEVERVHLDVDAAIKRFAGRFISAEDSGILLIFLFYNIHLHF